MARTINKTAIEANKKYQEAAKTLQDSTPNADQAIDYLKNFCYTYVAFIPGGRKYVDAAFEDIETVRKNHKDEVNNIVNDAYKQFQELSKTGLSLESLSKAYDILADLSKKIAALASDSLSDVLDNHPEIKDKFGGSIEQLKQMGESLGPEVQKQVQDTWKQAGELLAGGLTAANLDKARKLVQEKVEQVKKLGDEAWNKALEQAKPYLDKNPKIKELVEKNADALKQGNVTELFKQAKDAVDSGNMGGLESYVNSAVEKAKSKGSQMSGGFDQYLKMIPSGGDVLSKLQQLREVAEKHKDEGEKLLKETVEEIKQVLEKKAEKAKEIAETAKKESK
jgi:ABC-type transporter Mla subunit MlaD